MRNDIFYKLKILINSGRCIRIREYDAKEMFEALKKEDIYVRFWGSERIEQYMRVTVGTREEMEALFAFLRRYIKGE